MRTTVSYGSSSHIPPSIITKQERADCVKLGTHHLQRSVARASSLDTSPWPLMEIL
jgi:hypothetical protein